MHKYLYAHGDPIKGRDPSGLSLTGGQLATIGISGIVGSIVTSAVFHATGRSGAYGAITGFVGGSSLAYAFFTGRFVPVFLEAAFSGILAAGLSAIIDVHGGMDPRQNVGKYSANAIEAFAWTAFYAQWFKPSDLADHYCGNVLYQGDWPEYLVSGVVIQDLQILTQLGAVLVGGLVDLVVYGAKHIAFGLTPSEKIDFRNSVKDTASNVLDVVTGGIPSLVLSGAISSFYGFRYWPARLQGEIITGVLDAANFGAGVAIDAVADAIADSIADALLGGRVGANH